MTNQKSNSKRILLLLLVFFWPAGLIYYFIKNKEIKKTKEINWFLNHPFYAWIIILIFIGIIMSLFSTEEEAQRGVEEPKKEFISGDLEEIYNTYYGSGLTDLQKEYLWETEYKDKHVRWYAYVKNVEKRGLLTENDLMGTISKSSRRNQVGVKFRDSELSKLLSYSINSLIKFEGRLVSEGTILGSKIFYVKEAIIIE